MQVIVDTHVHIYPGFVSEGLFPAIAGRMDRLSDGQEHVDVLCLSERHDCRWFRDTQSAGRARHGDVEIEPVAGDSVALVIRREGMSRLYVIAGRQVVTRERLEILALGCDDDIADDAPVAEVVDVVLSRGGVPVISWAPGKWLFGRRSVVSDLLKRASPERLLVGDSAMRPRSWGEPSLMKAARDRGFRMVAGTDPLPMTGEERYIGTYCSVLTGHFDCFNPSVSLKNLLVSGLECRPAGRRCGGFEALGRLIRQRAGKAR